MKLLGSTDSALGTVAGLAGGSPTRTSLAVPAKSSVDGAGMDKAVGPSKARLADHALISIAEAYAAIQYNWDSSCSDSEVGNDHDDNYKRRRKYLLIDLEDGSQGGKSNPVQTMPKKMKKVLKKGGLKRRGRKQSVSVQSAAKMSEGLIVSDQQQEEILPRSDCFKRTTLPKETNDKCLIPVENVTDRSFEDETEDHHGRQLFPGIVPNEVVSSDVGNYSLQGQLISKKVQDKRNNSETVPLGEQHDSMNNKETSVIILSDSDDELDAFDSTESGDGVAGSSAMPEESDNERQVLMEGTTPVTVPHGEQVTTMERKDLVLMEGTTTGKVNKGEPHTFIVSKDLVLLEGTTPVAVPNNEQHTFNERKDLVQVGGTTPVVVPNNEQHTFMERKDLILMETTARPDELYSDEEFVIEPNESCDFEIDLSGCNTVRTSGIIQPGSRTLLDSDAPADGIDDGFSSEEETIVQIELQSYVNSAAENQTFMKERSLETQNSSLRWPVKTSSDGETVHDEISISVFDAIQTPEQAPIQNLKSCSRGITSSSEVRNISSEGNMKTAKVIQVSRHRDEMSSSEEGLSCAESGSDQRINQTKAKDVQADPLSVFSDDMAEETCYKAPQTAQTCDKCKLNFSSAEHLLKHFSKVHRNQRKTFGKRKRDNHHFRHASSSLSKLHWSVVNRKGYPTLQNAQSELRPSFREMLQKYSAKVEETDIFKHKRKHNCTICGEVSMSSQALHKHLMRHVGVTSFDCEVCGKVFISTSDLRQHLCTHEKHLKNEEYKCNECSLTFAKNARLMSHKAIRHQNECGHDCKVCGKTFPTAIRLKYHMLVHSENREFHCKICEKSFKCQKYLASHMYSHSQDRPFACSVCNKRYKRKQSRDVHEMKHENPLSKVSSFLFSIIQERYQTLEKA
ncbi:uncharacterized protein [Haliotis asinina]|uniref:uncharacterized protein n=1 Tax=Haliotis asinina TaxID=109174 RepID=UPI0035324379